ncbi:MAG: hypothetical protein IOMNBAOH_00839 [Rhodocyclaceae bacterium]|nr:hypothetical protein [Rhodocyclaceae bacterium]
MTGRTRFVLAQTNPEPPDRFRVQAMPTNLVIATTEHRDMLTISPGQLQVPVYIHVSKLEAKFARQLGQLVGHLGAQMTPSMAVERQHGHHAFIGLACLES